jgi:hypothetical protein
MPVSDINHVNPVIDHILPGQRRNAANVFQGSDVLGHQADLHEAFGIKGVPPVRLAKDGAKSLKLQIPESILRVVLGEQQPTVTAQDILPIQDIINRGKSDSADKKLVHCLEKTHPRTLLYRHFSTEKSLR